MLIWEVIKNSFKQFYEHLFIYVVINIIWFLFSFPVLAIGYGGLISGWYLSVLIPLILLGPFFMSGLHIAKRVVEIREINIKSYFKGIKLYFKKGLLGFLYSSLIYLVFVIDLIFFYRKGLNSIVFLVIAVIIFYLIIFFSLSQLFFWGLLTYQEDVGLWTLIKRSFLLVLDNIIFSILWFIFIILLLALLIVTGVGIPVALMGLITLIIINGTGLILEQYSEEEESDQVEQ